jgi:hypothetical protein
VSRKVPPGGYAAVAAILFVVECFVQREKGFCGGLEDIPIDSGSEGAETVRGRKGEIRGLSLAWGCRHVFWRTGFRGWYLGIYSPFAL